MSNFEGLPPHAVAKALARLCDGGLLNRIKRGVYYYGNDTPAGKTGPTALDFLRFKYFVAGLHAYNKLGLTNQIPVVMVIVSSTQAKIPGVRVLRRDIRHLRGATQEEFGVLEALRNITTIPDCSPSKAFSLIRDYIKKTIAFDNLVHFSKDEPPKVRALLGAIGQELKVKKALLDELHASISPLSVFRLGIDAKHGKSWNIR